MRILALESSAVAASAAICHDGKIISESFLNIGLTHSQTLLPLVNNALHSANLTMDDIDIIAVSAGPGSFTGIRIGVAAAKGLAFSDSKPCYGISTLEAMAWTMATDNCYICPVMDARCNQVYTALFKTENNIIYRISDDDAVKTDVLAESLKEYSNNIILIGDGAEKYYNTLLESGANITLAPSCFRQQHACGTAMAAWYQYCNGIQPVKSAELVPCYLRLSQAERERLNKEKGEQKNDSIKQ